LRSPFTLSGQPRLQCGGHRGVSVGQVAALEQDRGSRETSGADDRIERFASERLQRAKRRRLVLGRPRPQPVMDVSSWIRCASTGFAPIRWRRRSLQMSSTSGCLDLPVVEGAARSNDHPRLPRCRAGDTCRRSTWHRTVSAAGRWCWAQRGCRDGRDHPYVRLSAAA
jgi:hypothetical protein